MFREQALRLVDDIDSFASLLWEQAKRFYEKASEAVSEDARSAYLNSSIMLGFAALEAHVNAIAEEFANFTNVSVHDRGVLREREVRLEHGVFRLSGTTKFFRLEERVQFLHAKFGRGQLDRKAVWWADLQTALKLRNNLTHPKMPTMVKCHDVERALLAVIKALDALYQAIYDKPFPAYNRQLHSKLSF